MLLQQFELPLWDAPGARGEPGREAGSEHLRRVLIGDRLVNYVLRRGRRRTIGLTIDHRGLRVGAPPRSSMAEIESVIVKHAAWVATHLDAWRNRPAAQTTPVVDGMLFQLLGSRVNLVVGQGNNVFEWRLECDVPTLTLRARQPRFVLSLLERALRARALEIFAQRVADYCARYSINPPALHLSNARTRWGSCSRKSGVRLNWRLVQGPIHLIDYVVAHELAHLKEMNHTPRFWAEVGRMYPEWRAARTELARFGEQLPRWAAPLSAEDAPAVPVPV